MAKKQKQVRRDNLPDNSHVARQVDHQWLDWDPEKDSARGIIPQALYHRPELKEEYLSGSWLEWYHGNMSVRLKAVLAVHRANMKKIGPDSAVALLRAGGILSACVSKSRSVRVIHHATKKNSAYVKIEGLPTDNSDLVLLNAIIDEAFVGCHTCTQIDTMP